MFGAEDLKYLLVVMWVLGIECVSFKKKKALLQCAEYSLQSQANIIQELHPNV